MAERQRKRFSGVSRKQRVKMATRRDDVRSFRQRLSDLTSTDTGTVALFGGLAAVSLFFSWAPFVPEIIFFISLGLLFTFYRFSKKLWDLPFRVPEFLIRRRKTQFPARDASTGKEGEGNLYLGMDEESGEEVWANTGDTNKHVLMIGTTGSGKTENIMGHVFGMLALGSGTMVVDGKASVNTFDSVYKISRLLGRDTDLLTMDYLTGGKDMIGPQTDRRSHTYNALSFGGSAQKSEMFISLLSDSGDIWSDRAVSFVEAVMPALSYLSDQGMLLLNPDLLSHFVVLENLENLVHFGVFRDLHGNIIDLKQPEYAAQWEELRRRLKGAFTYFETLPGGAMAKPVAPWPPSGMPNSQYEAWLEGWYERNKAEVKRPEDGKNVKDDNARQKLNEQHGYVVMQFTRALNNLSNNYGYIYGAEIGEISFQDVVLNRRTMVVLLPALERSETNLEQLGRLTVIALKTVLGGLLNTRAEGSRREIIDGNPSNSRIPFGAILDEVGYYMVKGLSVIPAQARSLGVAMYFGTQSIPDLMKKSPEEGKSILDNTALKFFGRLTSDQESDTARTAINMGGKAHVQVADDVEFEQNMMGTGGRLKLGDRSSLQEQYQISYDDLANQENGEFHLIVGAKEIDDRGVKGGAPRTVRMLAFYTGLIPNIPKWRRNPFVKVLPAPTEEVVREREAERGRRFVKERLAAVAQENAALDAVEAFRFPAGLAQSAGASTGAEIDSDAALSTVLSMHRAKQFGRRAAEVREAKAGFIQALRDRPSGSQFEQPHVLQNLKSVTGELVRWAEARNAGRYQEGRERRPVERLHGAVVSEVDSGVEKAVGALQAAE